MRTLGAGRRRFGLQRKALFLLSRGELLFVGALEFDILLGDVRSLKAKRSVIRPIIAELQRFGVCAAEGGEHDRHRRSVLGVAVVSAEMAHLTEVLDRCERSVAARPDVELLAVRRRVFGPED